MKITVNVGGKDYIVGAPRAYETLRLGVVVAYHYHSTRNGKAFGAIRTASTASTKGVGVAIVKAAQEHFNADHEAMIAEATRLTTEFRASGKDGAYPSVNLITR